jgi:MtN3 and saliva related transmembrane protein
MSGITILGIGASLCTATASIPQLYKIIKFKKAEDISVVMLLVLVVGLGLWVGYGALKKDFIIMIANAIPFIVNVLILILSLRYKKNGGS